MSNTPEPCTRVRDAGRAPYVPSLRHLSFALAGTQGMIGRTGLAVCGMPGVVDQERAQHLISRHQPWRIIKIHELAPCQRCHSFVRR
jgi:hypothetical protein